MSLDDVSVIVRIHTAKEREVLAREVPIPPDLGPIVHVEHHAFRHLWDRLVVSIFWTHPGPEVAQFIRRRG